MNLKLFTNKKKLSDKIFCHWCGTDTYNEWDIRQGFNVIHNCIVATPPEHSNYDGKVLKLSLCNKHMDVLLDFLTENCKVNPIQDNETLL